MRPDQNEEFRRLILDRVLPNLVDGDLGGVIHGDNCQCNYRRTFRNKNNVVIEVVFFGVWSNKHFRGFCPDSFLHDLPVVAKHSKSNHASEPDRAKWRETVTCFAEVNKVTAWARVQQLKKLKAENVMLTDQELHKRAVEHGRKFLFADDDGFVNLTRIECEGVVFATHKNGVGYLFDVDPVTGSVQSRRSRAHDQESAA